jgi:hypothetical protein
VGKEVVAYSSQEEAAELNDALADARLRMAGMVDAGDLQAAERKLATMTEKLRVLSADWKRRANEERNEWYNDSQSIYRITEELDEILEKDGP